jgi:hypothetical protein
MADETPARKRYGTVIKWCRRLSAAILWLLISNWIRGASSPVVQVERLLSPVLVHLQPFPADRSTVALITLWYAFLTQLKIRWALWLPFYCVLYPIWWICWTGAKVFAKTVVFAASPLIGQLESLNETGTTATSPQSGKTPRSFPRKRVWLIALFMWLLVFRDLRFWWVAWLAPALAVPVWIFFLKTAYRFAIAPKSFATYIATTCSSMLETQIKTFKDAQEKKTKVVRATYVYNIVNGVLSRYSEAQMHTVVQREAMGIFTVALAIALAASAWFWGLIGVALLRTDSHVLDAYGFFHTGSLTEAVAWAWGCMTTAISFPGSLAPPWLKVVHGTILATGIFQLTFLLVCFSIMTNAETTRAVAQATELIKGTRHKLEETRALETTIIDAQVVTAEVVSAVEETASPGGSTPT